MHEKRIIQPAPYKYKKFTYVHVRVSVGCIYREFKANITCFHLRHWPRTPKLVQKQMFCFYNYILLLLLLFHFRMAKVKVAFEMRNQSLLSIDSALGYPFKIQRAIEARGEILEGIRTFGLVMTPPLPSCLHSRKV